MAFRSKTKTKPAAKPEKKQRAALPVKDCCGAQRGHKSTCPKLTAEEQAEVAETETNGASDLLDEVVEKERLPVSPQVADGQIIAALRGIEESLSRLAESVDTIKIQIGSYVNEVRVRATGETLPPVAKAPRKVKPAAEPSPEPAPEVESPKAKPEPAAEQKPAPAPKAETPKAPTADEIRSAFLAFASRKGRDAAVALLQSFGAAKLTEVESAKLPALFAKLQEG